ncbi:MAG TPA: cytochrome c [Jatrophihabitantaceae bacterium]|nr:cytochrome c [Jatrophihabitantaceae bacterium]
MSDEFDDDELGFGPAVSATGVDPEPTPRKAPKKKRPAARAPRGWRRRLASGLMLVTVLAGVAGTYTLFASSSGANDTRTSKEDVEAGRQLFNTSCITCHGANLQGVKDRGPSLIGVGSASVYFQVSTGRMPAAGQSANEPRKSAKFDEQQIDQLGAYIESLGNGPQIPQGDLRVDDSQLAEGGELFRLNCASCHGTTGKGAPLSAGKTAPGLRSATDKQIYAAMLSGPENMPVFGDNQLTPEQKKSILTYVQTLEASKDPGGNGLDRIGPVSEGIVIWVLGIGVLMIVILWIGAKT